jgi:hypothetical protein
MSATLYLMSRIAFSGEASPLSRLVMEHLALLSVDTCVHPTVRQTAHRLFGQWQRFADAPRGPRLDPAEAHLMMHEAIRKAMAS